MLDDLQRRLVERVGLAEDRAEAAIEEMCSYLEKHLPEPAARAFADFARRPSTPADAAGTKGVTTAAVAATTAAVNAVVLPGAH